MAPPHTRSRDCQANGVKGFCVAGAIANFTKQIVQACRKNFGRKARPLISLLQDRQNMTNPVHFGSRYGGDVDPASALKFIIHFVGTMNFSDYDWPSITLPPPFFAQATSTSRCMLDLPQMLAATPSK